MAIKQCGRAPTNGVQGGVWDKKKPSVTNFIWHFHVNGVHIDRIFSLGDVMSVNITLVQSVRKASNVGSVSVCQSVCPVVNPGGYYYYYYYY